MEAALGILSKVPDTIWAAVIASLLTIGGVVLTNLNSRKQQKEALVHDSNQRGREREMSLRRDVYLSTIEAISSFHDLLNRLPDLNFTEREFTSAIQGNSGVINKVHVTASNETVQSVLAIQQALALALLQIMPERAILIYRKNEIEEFSQLITRSTQEEERIIEVMRQQNIEGNTDERLWKVLNDNIEFERAQRNNHQQRIQELQAIQNPAHLQFAEYCFAEALKVAELLPAAILAIRKELDLPLDEKQYLDMCKENVQKAREVFSEFVNKIKSTQ